MMKRVALRGGEIAILVGILIFASRALHAATWVDFNSAGTPPTPFQLKRAKAQGIKLEPKPGTPLRGLIYEPEGQGPFPAVVLLHSCRGIRDYERRWAGKLSDWGYVALLVDSFEPRKAENICAKFHELGNQEVVGGRVADAVGARAFLAALSLVDKDRVAIMGWTQDAVLAAVFEGGIAQFFDASFQAAVAFYPNCSYTVSGKVTAPVLVLMGDQDDARKAEECERMAVASQDQLVAAELKLYPGVHHGFDDPEVGEHLYLEEAWNKYKNPAKGITYRYNREAHEDAQMRIKTFLEKHLK